MNITTKYDIGSTVFTMYCNELAMGTVNKITTHTQATVNGALNPDVGVMYNLVILAPATLIQQKGVTQLHNAEESDVYPSAEQAAQALVNKLNKN